jgi:hypothetical protein
VRVERAERQRAELGLGERRPGLGAAQELQRLELVEHVAECHRHADRHEQHHAQGMAPIHVLQELVQAHDEKEEDHVRHEAGQDLDPVAQLGGGDVAGGRGSIPRHPEGGQHELGEDRHDHEDEVQQSRATCCRLPWVHGSPPALRSLRACQRPGFSRPSLRQTY